MQDVILTDLRLVHFKNHAQAEFQFSPKLNALVGSNGAGKTTILDAVHVLCMTRSYFHSTDSHCIQFDAPFFVAEGSMAIGSARTPSTAVSSAARKRSSKPTTPNTPNSPSTSAAFPSS